MPTGKELELVRESALGEKEVGAFLMAAVELSLMHEKNRKVIEDIHATQRLRVQPENTERSD